MLVCHIEGELKPFHHLLRTLLMYANSCVHYSEKTQVKNNPLQIPLASTMELIWNIEDLAFAIEGNGF